MLVELSEEISPSTDSRRMREGRFDIYYWREYFAYYYYAYFRAWDGLLHARNTP